MEHSVHFPQNSNYFLQWVDNAQTKRVRVTPDGLIIGRDPTAVVNLVSTQVSWHHAQISCPVGEYFLTDLNSTNGTFVNDQWLAPSLPVRLGSSDVIKIGEFSLDFFAGSHESGVSPTRELAVEGRRTADRIVVGRSQECDVVLPFPDVSWQHARLSRQSQGWLIEDLGSRNGTWVNETRITKTVVHAGDRIRVGLNRFSMQGGQVDYISDVGQVRLEATGLTRTVWKNGSPHTLLRDVSLTIEPQELVAIIGSSGAGKSTLLLALNGYQPASRGQIRLNGIDYYSNLDLFQTIIGYVPQSDIVHSDLQVESALRYAALLRLPPDTTESEITELVMRVLEDMGLMHRRHHLVRTLSGGERKRVNIGVELLTRPSLLFLDEPTTGLDAGLERRVVRQLRTLADEGRTVVVVTHSVQTLEEYDKVAVMARGGVLAYYGPPGEAARHFGVADFAGIYDRLNQSATGIHWDSGHSPPALPLDSRPSAPAASPPKVSIAKQGAALLGRYLEVIRSDTRNLVSWIVQAPAVALIIALLFHANIFAQSQSPDAQGNQPIQDAPRLLFLIAFTVVCFGLCNSSRELVKEHDIYRRERHVGLRILPYLLSKIIVLGFVSFFQCLVLLLIVGLKIDFGVGIQGIALMLALLFLGALNAILLGLVISAWASSSDQAVTLIAIILLLQVIFSGLIPLENMNIAFQGFSALCMARWTYGGLCGVTELPKRWADVGLGSQVHDLFRTPVATAITILILMSLGLFAALWVLLVKRDERRS